jgi:peptidoglycan hydrolase CwlO-like protein
MKKSILKLLVTILILSGWVAFAILYAVSGKNMAQKDTEISELKSELDSYQFLVKDVEESAGKIDSIIGNLENLKVNLGKLKNKMGKGVENESSENRE